MSSVWLVGLSDKYKFLSQDLNLLIPIHELPKQEMDAHLIRPSSCNLLHVIYDTDKGLYDMGLIYDIFDKVRCFINQSLLIKSPIKVP